MDPPSSDIVVDTPYFRIYSDRRIDRLVGTDTVPAGFDPTTGVTSKDVVVDSDAGVYVRLYLPDTATGSDDSKKLPVLVYFHGGGFVTHSAASPPYQSFLNTLAAKAGLLIVSVNYRLAPEHPLPAGYEDSFRALRWAASGSGDPWLSHHGDLARIFLAGDSAGGNFVHNIAVMAAASEVPVRIRGAVLLHAGFGGRERIDGETPESVALMEKLWGVVCPRGKLAERHGGVVRVEGQGARLLPLQPRLRRGRGAHGSTGRVLCWELKFVMCGCDRDHIHIQCSETDGSNEDAAHR
uniref:Alpha/beta hydrolase fold-3 domain-containing protein n=1 Tax=Zea mays TaxID=4577 RepID=A0A804QDF1_MAIZE